MNTYSVKAKCHLAPCKVTERSGESQAYVGHELEAHQLVLLPLYAHTQHGNCGLDVKLDGKTLL